MRPAETGGFGLGDGGGVEFAVGGVYDGFVVIDVEREVIDFLAAQSVYVVLDYEVGLSFRLVPAYLVVLNF